MIVAIIFLILFIIAGIGTLITSISAGDVATAIWNFVLLAVFVYLLHRCWIKRKKAKQIAPQESEAKMPAIAVEPILSAEYHSKPQQPRSPRNITPKTKAAIKSFIKTGEYVVLDVETTGLNPNSCKIIELAMLRKANGEVADTYSRLFNPGEPLPPKIVQMTGITDEMLADAPEITSALEEIDSFIGGRPIVAHNARFDVCFLEAAMGETQKYDYIDTVALARRAYPEMVNHKLGTLTEALGIENLQKHRAMSDAEAADKLLSLCLDKILSTVKKRN